RDRVDADLPSERLLAPRTLPPRALPPVSRPPSARAVRRQDHRGAHRPGQTGLTSARSAAPDRCGSLPLPGGRSGGRALLLDAQQDSTDDRGGLAMGEDGRPQRRRGPEPRTVLAIASIGASVALLDATIVNIAFPS